MVRYENHAHTHTHTHTPPDTHQHVFGAIYRRMLLLHCPVAWMRIINKSLDNKLKRDEANRNQTQQLLALDQIQQRVVRIIGLKDIFCCKRLEEMGIYLGHTRRPIISFKHMHGIHAHKFATNSFCNALH